MRARALNGNEIDIEQGTIDGLKMRLRGPVLVPDDHGYEEARTVWNAMIDKKPALVARLGCKIGASHRQRRPKHITNQIAGMTRSHTEAQRE